MGVLTLGRIGVDVEIEEVEGWNHRRGKVDDQITLTGELRAATADDTDYLRTELANQAGMLIAVTYSHDPILDGFYILERVTIGSEPWSYDDEKFYRFSCELKRIGSEASTELQSLITAADIQNDFGTTPQYFHATPPGALAYSAGAGNPTEISRVSEDGAMSVYLDVSASEDPAWAISPANYYKAAAEIWTQDRLRAGRELLVNDPTDWYLTNGLMQVRAATFQDTSNGRIQTRWYDGTAWGTWIDWKITWSATSDIPQWHYLTVVRNTPEVVQVRLVRDAATVPASAQRHTLDISLRRGSRFASFVYTYFNAQDHRVGRNVTDAASRPGGDASYITDTGLIDGNRWVLGCPFDFTADTTNGHITLDVANDVFPFFIGAAIDDAANDSGDGPADLTKQYTGYVAESVRAVRR